MFCLSFTTAEEERGKAAQTSQRERRRLRNGSDGDAGKIHSARGTVAILNESQPKRSLRGCVPGRIKYSEGDSDRARDNSAAGQLGAIQLGFIGVVPAVILHIVTRAWIGKCPEL